MNKRIRNKIGKKLKIKAIKHARIMAPIHTMRIVMSGQAELCKINNQTALYTYEVATKAFRAAKSVMDTMNAAAKVWDELENMKARSFESYFRESRGIIIDNNR